MLDNEQMEISCGDCGRKIKKKIGWLKRNKQLTCSCGAVTRLETKKLLDGARSAEKSLKDFEKELGKGFDLKF